MCVGGFCGLNDFFFGDAGFGVFDILNNGAAKQNGFLRDDTDLLPVAGLLCRLQRNTVNAYLTFYRIVKPVQQLHECAFACATGTYQSYGLSGFDGEANALNHFLVVAVMEVDVIEFYFPFDARQGFGVWQITNFTFHCEDFKNPFAGTDSFLHTCVQACETPHWSCDDGGVKDEGDEFTWADFPENDFASSIPQ